MSDLATLIAEPDQKERPKERLKPNSDLFGSEQNKPGLEFMNVFMSEKQTNLGG